jgi:arginyl-tRNA synthetase
MVELHAKEKELLKQLELFPEVIQNAAQNHSPALLANYDLEREYNSFIKRYHSRFRSRMENIQSAVIKKGSRYHSGFF